MGGINKHRNNLQTSDLEVLFVERLGGRKPSATQFQKHILKLKFFSEAFVTMFEEGDMMGLRELTSTLQ